MKKNYPTNLQEDSKVLGTSLSESKSSKKEAFEKKSVGSWF